MTRRETRKTRSERRSRLEAEGLESRNLLSGVGAVGAPDLEVHHPHVTLTPEVMAVDVGTGSGGGGGKFVADVKKAPPAKIVADAKVDFFPPEPIIPTGPSLFPPEPIIPTGPSLHPPEPCIPTGPSLHPPEPCISRGPAPQILIGLHPTTAVVDDPYQTSVWGGIESIGTIKKG